MEEFELNKYEKSKDYAKSPFRYPGGKFYALKHIIPFLDSVEHDEYREPFLGGGSVYLAKAKTKYNWINDLEEEIINVYQHIANSEIINEFAEMYDNEIASKIRHKEVINSKPNTAIDRAFRTYYLNRTSYSGIIHKPAWGYKEGKSSPPKNWKNFLVGSSKKLDNIKITSVDFEKVIRAKKKGKKVLIYLDPPYFKADQKRAYTKSFETDDHLRLAKVLKSTEHYFCLSYDDCEEVRKLYSWANIYERNWLYNTANISGKSRNTGNELIITNFKVKDQRFL
ncbi:MAG: DNA adenine methylase [Fluviicola sp.]|nr:DNA adenine methylase [Fluviicola sp.]